MKPPSPFILKGSFMERQTARRRSNLRTVVLCVMVFHILMLGGWLIQGCKHRHEEGEKSEVAQINSAPTSTTNAAVQPARPATDWSITSQPMSPQSHATVGTTKATVPIPAGTTRDYRVARGDTLARIAQRNGVSQRELAKANPGVQTAKLRAGQVLRIPDSSQAVVAAKRMTNAVKGDAHPPGGDSIYTVKSGDTLSKVAQTHGTTISALRALNELESDQLTVGKTLKLPIPTVSVENSSGPAVSATSSNGPAQP
jgi:LysM repeat protein